MWGESLRGDERYRMGEKEKSECTMMMLMERVKLNRKGEEKRGSRKEEPFKAA